MPYNLAAVYQLFEEACCISYNMVVIARPYGITPHRTVFTVTAVLTSDYVRAIYLYERRMSEQFQARLPRCV
jgi:hypothetical protein